MKTRNPLAGLVSLDDHWSRIAEKIAADAELVESLEAVLGYEQDCIDTGPFFDLPPDISHARACKGAGESAGLEIAYRALTDPRYIAQKRDWIQTQLKEAEA